jgi:hypothetical protein
MPEKIKVKLGGHGEIGLWLEKVDRLYNPRKLG